MKWLVLALMMTAASARADECETLDVRRGLNAEMKAFFSTPRNQNDIGWCFAYAAADLLSHRYQKPVSAFHVGLTYHHNVTGLGSWVREIFGSKQSGLNEGGHVGDAISVMTRHGGVCLEGDVSSQPGRYGGFQKPLLAAKKFMDHPAQALSPLEELELKEFLRARYPNVDPSVSVAFLTARRGTPADKVLLELTEKTCAKNAFTISNKLRLTFQPKSQEMPLVPMVNYALKRRTPVAISYRYDAFVRPDLVQGGVLGFFQEHVSVIIGRKKVGDQCMYVVRNSWGQSCTEYREGVPCDREQGTFMMSARDLERYGSTIEYFRN